MPVTRINHRFYGERHTRHQQHTRTLLAIMFHIRLFVKLEPYPMSAQIPDHRASVLVGMFGNSVTQVTDKDVWFGTYLLANLQTFPGNIDQSLTLWSCLANDEHSAGIGIIAIQNGGTIHIDDITFLQDVVFAGNTMTDHIVDAGAAGIGITFVVKGCGNTTMGSGIVVHQFVYFESTHTLADMFCNIIQYGSVQNTCLADTMNLLLCLNKRGSWDKFAFLLPIQYYSVHFCRFQSSRNEPTRGFILLIFVAHALLFIKFCKITTI